MIKLEDMQESNRTRVAVVAINLLLSMIGLFAHPGQWLPCIVYPWAVFLLSFVGYIPFAGFLAFYWLYKEALVNILWTNQFGLGTSWFTSLLFVLYFLISMIRTLQWTSKLSGQISREEG